MILILFIFPIYLEYGYESYLYKILIGMLYYISFVAIFEELRALIALNIMIKKLKEDQKARPNFRDVYFALVITFQYILLIGFIPLLFILNNFNITYIGMLISGLIYIIYYLNKLIYIKRQISKNI